MPDVRPTIELYIENVMCGFRFLFSYLQDDLLEIMNK